MTLDPATFERIVDAHYESLYRFAFSLTGQESDAWDLTQETFRRLARQASALRDSAKVKSWLFTTLYRQFLDSHRARRRHPEVQVAEAEAELPATQPNLINRLDAQTVCEALSRVDTVFRVPLALFYLGEHSYADIAQILGVPIGTVMSRIARGRAQLRKLLADRLGDKPASATVHGASLGAEQP
jgi:RNA polymerase sigma-70 factor (ECF subfamily)